MSSLSVAIMAHPVRRAAARRLAAALDREVPIVWDENPVPSADRAQRWATGARAWRTGLARSQARGWVMVVQDDAVVCGDLIAGLEKAVEMFPTDDRGRPQGLVSAYTGTGRPNQYNVKRALRRADDHGSTWMDTRSLNWGVAIAAPAWTVPDMLAWCADPSRANTNYDYRIGVYYRDVLDWRTWYTVPSLVEHAGLRSLVGHGTGPARRAHRFHGREASALTVDWTRVPPEGLDPVNVSRVSTL